MLDLTSHSLLPGSWTATAQRALDRLGTCGTLTDVRAEFASARELAEATLGYAANGGRATKPVVRALGQLLQHRLGPAVACEALALASGIGDVIDAHTVETLFHEALEVRTACRPSRIDELGALRDRLLAEPTIRRRRQALLSLWSQIHWSSPQESWDEWRDLSHSVFWLDFTRDMDLSLDSFWLSERWQSGNEVADVFQVLLHCEPDDGLHVLRAQAQAGIDELVRHPDLFELRDCIVSALAHMCPQQVFRHPRCPSEILQHLRAPRSMATLVLALRAEIAGYGHTIDAVAFKRLLSALDDNQLTELVRLGVGTELSRVMYRAGLLTPEKLCGPLASVFLNDDDLRSVLPGPWVEASRFVAEVVKRHPNHDFVARLLQILPSSAMTGVALLPSSLVHEMLSHPDSTVRRGAERHADVCPGLPARLRRPSQPIRHCDPSEVKPKTVLHYDDRFNTLDGVGLLDRPGWHLALPRSVGGLASNARVMRNCTVDYAGAILDGEYVVLIVHSPDGDRFNVGLKRCVGERWFIEQINGYANQRHRVPEWLLHSIVQTVTAALLSPIEPATRVVRRRRLTDRPRKVRRRVSGGARRTFGHAVRSDHGEERRSRSHARSTAQ